MSWFSVCAKNGLPLGKAISVNIHGDIGWEVSASELIKEIKAQGPDVSEIELSIHSNGGSVTEGWAIVNFLRRHPAHIVARVEGSACSMASVIAMASDHLIMPENAYLMIHNPWTIAMGDAAEMEKAAANLRKFEKDIVDLYARRSGKGEAEIRQMMTDETWMNGAEAFAAGFCDHLEQPLEIAAFGRDDMASVLKAGLKLPSGLVGAVAEEEEISGDGLVVVTPVVSTPEADSDADSSPEVVAPSGDEVTEPVAPVVAPVVPESDEEEKPADAENFHKNFFQRVREKLFGKSGREPDGNPGAPETAAGGEAQAWRAERSDVLARLGVAEAALREKDGVINALQAENTDLKSQQRKVWDLVAEAGWPAHESLLPPPDGDEPTPSGMLAKYRSISDPQKRREFLAANQSAINDEMLKAAKV
jgi:ATP-dependent protease ClpP protease subunit